ncbi:MAG: hypothetical protein AAFN44_05970 [Pseudomonadota bacterium]
MHVERLRNDLLSVFERYGVVLSLIALAVITGGSLVPRESGGDVGSADKVLHLVAYAVAILPLTQHKTQTRLIFAIGVLIWSGAIELVQPFVGRSASLLDLASNAAGLLLGLALGVLLDRVAFKNGSDTA